MRMWTFQKGNVPVYGKGTNVQCIKKHAVAGHYRAST